MDVPMWPRPRCRRSSACSLPTSKHIVNALIDRRVSCAPALLDHPPTAPRTARLLAPLNIRIILTTLATRFGSAGAP